MEEAAYTGDFHFKDKAEVSRYCKKLFKWFNLGVEEAACRSVMVTDKWKLSLGCIVYGDTFVERFLKYCVPSLLAEGNIPAIADSPIWIIIQTDKASVHKLKADNGLKKLGGLGVCIEIQIVPEEVLAGVPDDDMNKYWVIGAAHNLQMYQAKYMGYAYHMLMPDHIYSKNYFKNLKRLAKDNDAIVQAALSARIESASALLDNDGVLSLDGSELNAIALDHLHAQFDPYIMNGRDYKTNSPIHSFMFFLAKDSVHIICPHMSPVYFSHETLLRCPPRLFNTIDSQLPFFIRESATVCVPKPEDDMAYIEISDDQKASSSPEPMDILMFCVRFWTMTFCETGFLRYFNMDTILQLPKGYKHKLLPMENDQIETVKSAVREAVRNSRESIMGATDAKYHTDPLPQRAA